MPIAALPAVLGAIGVGGSIGTGIAGIYGAGKAATTQANAANYAAQLDYEASQNALNFEKQIYADQQANQLPWVHAGQGAINQLSALTSTPGQGLLTPWTQQFQAPTGATEQNDPGYQFRLQQGQQALERSAAARGGVLSGGTAKAISRYGQDYASNEYQNVYNRAYNEYATKYNAFENNQSNEYNRLAGVAGLGQVSANNLSLLGGQVGNNVTNNLLGTAQGIGNAYQNAAYQRASGYAAQNNYLGNLFGNLGQLGYLFGQQQNG